MDKTKDPCVVDGDMYCRHDHTCAVEEAMGERTRSHIHEGVVLLVKRMESHPEEFGPETRMTTLVEEFMRYGNEQDKDAIVSGLYSLRMARMHSKLMDLILNDTGSQILYATMEDRASPQQLYPPSTSALASQQQAYSNQYQSTQGYSSSGTISNQQYVKGLLGLGSKP